MDDPDRRPVRGWNGIKPGHLGVRVVVGKKTQAAGNLQGLTRGAGYRIRQAANP